MRPVRIYQFGSNRACAPYRMRFPGAALNRRGRVLTTFFSRFSREMLVEVFSNADILIVQRLPMSPTLRAVANGLKARGKALVLDLDDDLFHLPPESRFARQAPSGYVGRLLETIAAADAVQCSTASLKSILDRHHSEVVVLENQLDTVPDFCGKPSSGPVIIGYAAGEDHAVDWASMSGVFNATIAELEREGAATETWILGDRDIYDTVQGSHKRFFPIMPRPDYLDVLRRCDISLLPLAPLPFNQSKSDIKFLESASCGAAVLAAELVYGNSVAHGKTGYCYRDTSEFAGHLKELVHDPSLRLAMAAGAHKHVRHNRLIDQHMACWESTYLRWHERFCFVQEAVNV